MSKEHEDFLRHHARSLRLAGTPDATQNAVTMEACADAMTRLRAENTRLRERLESAREDNR